MSLFDAINDYIVIISLDITKSNSGLYGRTLSSTIDFNQNIPRPLPQANTISPDGISKAHNSAIVNAMPDIRQEHYFTVLINAELNFKTTQPESVSIENVIDFTLSAGGDSPVGEEQIVFSGGWQSGQEWGKPTAINFHTYVTTPAIKTDSYGKPAIYNLQTYLQAKSFDSSAIGKPSIINIDQFVTQKTTGVQTIYGVARIYNLLQFVRASGYSASTYGRAYVQGGVKYVSARGYDASTTGKPLVINTTANQQIKTSGFVLIQQVPSPIVSPHMIYPKSITGLAFGKVVATKTPVLAAKGYVQTQYGRATTWYHTRLIKPSGLSAYESGYPIVYDPTQEIQTPSLITSAIFGDTAIRNTTVFIRTQGINDLVVTPWAVVINHNRYLGLYGFDTQAFGDALTYNKTPSVFVQGINQSAIGSPAIGYSIRTVKPSGFDRLIFGKPALIKTPELNPRPFTSSIIGTAFISNWVRTLDFDKRGIDALSVSSPTAWFRWRYADTKGWQSSKFGASTLTHGVREVIGRGFTRESLGTAWVSFGLRAVEPSSIFKEFPTRHMIGGSRHVKPYGYIATLFGTRIIPEVTRVYPQGFAGALGLTSVRLNTSYLKVAGFISVGQQPADRWGWALAYNLTQYVQQNFDNASGLVPPRWSIWTKIENRNKRLNASGFNSQRIGYNKIDNHARQLLPKGINPLSIRIGMIAQANRPITLEGISPPMIGGWTVAFNGARVIAPIGSSYARFGLHSTLNTRRYYSGVGRFESLETGVPMISYAIREVQIEPRYAIAPPQINLPTIDVLTKYVEVTGFSLDAYGTATLSIHFNIIAPKWVHRDKMGEGSARNLTPEVATYGHNSELFGANAIRTQWRVVQARGEEDSRFGFGKVADRKQLIVVRGWRDTVVAQKHSIIKSGAPLYSEQRISLDGWTDYDKEPAEYVSGNGIYFNERLLGQRVPNPSLNQNVLYAEMFAASLYGVPSIRTNVIEVVAGIAIHNVSSGLKVENRNLLITLEENNAIKSEIAVGKPRMSPWTIWAVTEAPAQARTNHQAVSSHVVDGHYYSSTFPTKIGKPKVDNKQRSIVALGYSQSSYGKPSLQLTRKVVSPKSFNSRKFGMPSIPFTPQYLLTFNPASPLTLWGTPALRIREKFNRQVKPATINSLVFGRTDIQLYTRELKTLGHNSQSMGTRKQSDKPYMWQGLRVGPHVPLIIGGDDTSIFGEGMVSLRIRGIDLVGFETFVSEYDVNNFNQRMTVRLRDKNTADTQRITTQSFISSNSGQLGIDFGQYFIRPDGNSDQFRKGGYHA